MKRLLISVLLVSCGYRWSPAESLQITVPFVAGDEEGNLTTEIIRACAAGGLRIVPAERASHRLEISLNPETQETIGYRLDRQKIRGEIQKNMVAIEARRIQTVTVSLVNVTSGQVEIGPMQIGDEVDYDYYDGDSSEELAFTTPNGFPHTVLSFSLGQLESPESAHDAAGRPLYRRIAQRVVEAVQGGWACR